MVARSNAVGYEAGGLAFAGAGANGVRHGSVWAGGSSSAELGVRGGEAVLDLERIPEEIVGLYREAVVRMSGSIKKKSLKD